MLRIPGVSDVLALLQAQTEALASLPSTMLALNRSIRSLSKSIEQGRETFAAVQRVAVRTDRMLDELEEPLLALGPGLRKLAAVLDDPVVEELPATLRTLQDELLPVARNLNETQQRVASIAQSTERFTSLVDEAGARLGALPMASLLRRQWRTAEPPPAETPPEEM